MNDNYYSKTLRQNNTTNPVTNYKKCLTIYSDMLIFNTAKDFQRLYIDKE